MVSIPNEFPEVLGFVSLYKAFSSPLQCLFSSFLLIQVPNFLSTALAWLNQHNTEEGYTGDKITFFYLCRKLYPVFLPEKDYSMMWTEFCTLIKKGSLQFYFILFLKELDTAGKTIWDFMLFNSPGGKNITTCVFSSDSFGN